MPSIKKYYTQIFLFFLLIGLPAASYFYLNSGKSFYKANMAELEPKAQVQPFEFPTLNGESLKVEPGQGFVSVLNFLPHPCDPDCEKLMQNLYRLQEQFKKTGKVRILTSILDTVSDSSLTWLAFQEKYKAEENMWYAFNSPREQALEFAKGIYEGNEMGKDPDYLILMDDSLKVRNYYHGTDSSEVRQLVLHLSMIMPKEERKEVKFKREKEK